jgi:hypothetical protein
LGLCYYSYPFADTTNEDGESRLTDVVRHHILNGQPNSILTGRVEKKDSAGKVFSPWWEMKSECVWAILWRHLGCRLLFEN